MEKEANQDGNLKTSDSLQPHVEVVEQESQEIIMGGVEYRLPASLKLDNLEDLQSQWQRFKQSFKIFILAAGYEKLSENRKAAILLNCVGEQAQELYFNTLKKGDAQKYEDVLEAFDEYFQPKQNEVINSYNFNKRSQDQGETFDNFYTDLRKLMKNCMYGSMEDRILRDRIVIGVQDVKVQEKLLSIKNLTLDQAVDICRSVEMSRQHVKHISKQAGMEAFEVKAEQHPQQNSRAKYNQNNKTMQPFTKTFYKCFKCNTVHGARNCPAFGKTCNNCKKLGHFAVGCKAKKMHVLNNDTYSSEHEQRSVEEL